MNNKIFPLIFIILLLGGGGIFFSDFLNQSSPEPEQAPRSQQPAPEPESEQASRSQEPAAEPEPVPKTESGPRIIIILPFDPQNPPDDIMPMGETVKHKAEVGGHPGIDFQWYAEAPKLYSSAGGEIVELLELDGGDWSITINHTGFDKRYYTAYSLGSYNTELEVGDKVEKYTFLGYVPNPHPEDNMYGTHWEFGVDIFTYFESGNERIGYSERLCPLTYFDEDSRTLIEKTWITAKYEEKDQFPLLCNGFYEGRDGELQDFSIRSNNFEDGEKIPVRFTCDGDDISPHLEWFNVPDGTVELALEMHDPDAPVSGGWTHWVIFNINPDITSIATNSVPEGSKEARNSFGKTPYGGPCPPSGTHRYIFKLYALDTNLESVSSLNDLHSQIKDHVIGEAKLTGKYSRG